MRISHLIAFTLSISMLDSNASTVTWGAQNSNSLGLEDGSLALQGSLVRLGYFTVPDAQVQSWALAGDKTSLNGAFSQFGANSVGNGYPGVDGVWDAQSVNGNVSFVGQNIYMWTFDAATIGAATQWGIFKGAGPSWVFPTDVPVPGSTTIDLGQVPQTASGLIVGTFGGGPDANFSAPLYRMTSITPVPEPSMFTAGVILGLAAVGARRRRRA